MQADNAIGTGKRPRSRYALLGVLSMGLETGYAMKQHVEANLGHFWSESYGQIYPLLRQLVDEGLATCEAERQPGDRGRKRYQLTPAGWNELRSWCDETLDHLARIRNETRLTSEGSGSR